MFDTINEDRNETLKCNSAAVNSRIRNDMPNYANTPKDQYSVLDLEIREKSIRQKHVVYSMKAARKSQRYNALRQLETQFRVQKQLLRHLKAERKRIFNELTSRSFRPCCSRNDEINRKIQELRRLRLCREPD